MGDEQLTSDWLRRIRSEFYEMPGLQLTRRQAQRLWALDAQFCDALLDTLVSSTVLEKTQRDASVLSGGKTR